MIQIELTPQDAEFLADALESYLSDLRMEISDTDSMDFREKLKEQKAALSRTLDALRARV